MPGSSKFPERDAGLAMSGFRALGSAAAAQFVLVSIGDVAFDRRDPSLRPRVGQHVRLVADYRAAVVSRDGERLFALVHRKSAACVKKARARRTTLETSHARPASRR
jgi:hypothetical protein